MQMSEAADKTPDCPPHPFPKYQCNINNTPEGHYIRGKSPHVVRGALKHGRDEQCSELLNGPVWADSDW